MPDLKSMPDIDTKLLPASAAEQLKNCEEGLKQAFWALNAASLAAYSAGEAMAKAYPGSELSRRLHSQGGAAGSLNVSVAELFGQLADAIRKLPEKS